MMKSLITRLIIPVGISVQKFCTSNLITQPDVQKYRFSSFPVRNLLNFTLCTNLLIPTTKNQKMCISPTITTSVTTIVLHQIKLLLRYKTFMVIIASLIAAIIIRDVHLRNEPPLTLSQRLRGPTRSSLTYRCVRAHDQKYRQP